MQPVPVRMQQNVAVATDTHLLTLDTPRGFSFVPGQFLVVETPIAGKTVRRSYSIASAPGDEQLALLVKRQPHGVMSVALCEAQPGTILGVLGPFGTFTFPESPLVLVAAGTGIAPFRSLVRQRHGTALVLVYAAKNPGYLLPEAQFPGVQQFRTVETADKNWTGHVGRIDAALLDRVAAPPEATWCVCGPTGMVSQVRALLTARGIPRERIRTELHGNTH